MPESIIVFAPHPDDETLACGGSIALNIRQGNEVFIVFMTDGRYSHKHSLGIEAFPTPEDIKAIRAEEAGRVTGILGVKKENLAFLEYEDGALGKNMGEAVIRVQLILEKIKPGRIYCPAANDKHRDHKATHTAVQKAVRNLALPVELYQYVVWKSGKEAASKVEVDISGVLEIKKRAMAEYKSQVTLFSDRQSRPILITRFLNKFLVNTEVFSV